VPLLPDGGPESNENGKRDTEHRNERKLSMCERPPIGEIIKQRREELGLSQEELAERLNVSRQSVSKWETGLAAPSRRNMEDLARALGFELRPELVTEEELAAAEDASVRQNARAWKIAAAVLAICACVFGGLWLSERAKPAAEPIDGAVATEPRAEFPNNLEGLSREDCEELQKAEPSDPTYEIRRNPVNVIWEYLGNVWGMATGAKVEFRYANHNETQRHYRFRWTDNPELEGEITVIQPLETGENGIWVVSECTGPEKVVEWLIARDAVNNVDRTNDEDALKIIRTIYPPEVTFVREADEELTDSDTGLTFPCAVWSVYVGDDLRSQIAVHSREKIWVQNTDDWPLRHDWSGAYRYGEGYAATYMQQQVWRNSEPHYELQGAPDSLLVGPMGPDRYFLYAAGIPDIEELTTHNEGGIEWTKSTQTVRISSTRSTGTHTGAVEGMVLWVEAVKEGDTFRVTDYGTEAGPYFTHPSMTLNSHFKIEITEFRAAEIAAIAYDIISREIAKYE